MPAFVIDNGAYEIKAGFAGQNEPSRVVNALTRSKDRRVYLSNELKSCKDYGGLVIRRPHEQGQLVNWELEKVIWDHIFSGEDTKQPVDTRSTTLVLTETPYQLPALSGNTDQVVFEQYEFDAYYKTPAPALVPWAGQGTGPDTGPADAALVIDSGFSSTHIVPVLKGEPHWSGLRRVDVGGKLLTNYLKETVSFRHYNMMEETFLMNVVKEAVCFVSGDFAADIDETHANKRKSKHAISYVLPDYRTSTIGHVLRAGESETDHQVLRLTNERFTVPELLFRPGVLGVGQAGVAEAAAQSLEGLSPEEQSLLLANVVLVGGTSRLPGFKDRIHHELRSFAPQNSLVRVRTPQDPIGEAWRGGSSLAQSGQLDGLAVTRAEYLEHGPNICLAKFGPPDEDDDSD